MSSDLCSLCEFRSSPKPGYGAARLDDVLHIHVRAMGDDCDSDLRGGRHAEHVYEEDSAYERLKKALTLLQILQAPQTLHKVRETQRKLLSTQYVRAYNT